MELFKIENKRVLPNPETLLIKVFKDIIDNYEYEYALLLFAYIEFMLSYKKTNPFIGYTDKEQKKEAILKALPQDISSSIDDDYVVKAYEWYENIQNEASPSLKFYKSSLSAAASLSDFLNNVDLTKTTRSGALLYKPKDITSALKDTADIIKNLKAMKDTVEKELETSSKGKAGRSINYFEK